jgi:hypothetical protein
MQDISFKKKKKKKKINERNVYVGFFFFFLPETILGFIGNAWRALYLF